MGSEISLNTGYDERESVSNFKCHQALLLRSFSTEFKRPRFFLSLFDEKETFVLASLDI